MTLTDATNSSTTPASSTTSFARKLDVNEQKHMAAQIGYLKQSNAVQFITDERQTQRVLESQGTALLADGSLDLKSIPTLYIKNCHSCQFTLTHRTVKLLIENCSQLELKVEANILTGCIEAWKCQALKLQCITLKTLQLDLSENVEITLPTVDDFGSIVWNAVEVLKIQFSDSQHQHHNLSTGFKEMSVEHPDSDKALDQFFIRYVGGVLKSERGIRLKNGFLTTEREAVEWEKKNERMKEAFVEKFLKEGGIRLNKKPEKKIPPNDPCPCGSGKKHKKCCFNKTTLTGVDDSKKVELWKK